MPDLIAKETFTYAGKKIKKGAVFTPTKKDAEVLVLIGRAAISPDVQATPQPQKPQTYQRRDMQAAVPEIKPKRTYTPRAKKTADSAQDAEKAPDLMSGNAPSDAETVETEV